MDTRKKLKSKKDVRCYIKSEAVQHGNMQFKRKSDPIVIKTNEVPEWLPRGWIMDLRTRKSGSLMGKTYKCYIDPYTKRKFYSKPEVTQYLQTVSGGTGKKGQKKKNNGRESSTSKDVPQNNKSARGKTRLCNEKDGSAGKNNLKSISNDMDNRNAIEGLPPGWMKEIRTRKYAHGIKKDPYYIDPISGYIFRSKKDVFRYLETGNIASCVSRPKRRENDLERTKDDHPRHLQVEGKKLGISGTRRKLFVDKNSSKKICTRQSESQISKEIQENDFLHAANATTPADIFKEQKLFDDANECAETKAGSLQNTKCSEVGVKAIVNEGGTSPPEVVPLHQHMVEKNSKEKLVGGNVSVEPRKSKDRRAMPGRFSRRLAGIKPDNLTSANLSERALRAAVRKSEEINSSSGMVLNVAAEGEQVFSEDDAKSEPQVTENVSTVGKSVRQTNSSSRMVLNVVAEGEQMLSKDNAKPDPQVRENVSVVLPQAESTHTSSKHPAEERDLPEAGKQLSGRQGIDDPRSQNLLDGYPFLDCWSDPCLEFAFKTLTGAIPVEDGLTFQGCTRQQCDSSYGQDGCFELPLFDTANYYPNDLPFHSDSVHEQHTLPPPRNVNLNSGIGPQQGTLEARNKDYQTRLVSKSHLSTSSSKQC